MTCWNLLRASGALALVAEQGTSSVGQRITVATEFKSDLVRGRRELEDAVFLRTGLQGTVKRVDEDGDLLIMFDELPKAEWVRQRDFGHTTFAPQRGDIWISDVGLCSGPEPDWAADDGDVPEFLGTPDCEPLGDAAGPPPLGAGSPPRGRPPRRAGGQSFISIDVEQGLREALRKDPAAGPGALKRIERAITKTQQAVTTLQVQQLFDRYYRGSVAHTAGGVRHHVSGVKFLGPTFLHVLVPHAGMEGLAGYLAFDVAEGSINPKYVASGSEYDRRCVGRCVARRRQKGRLQVIAYDAAHDYEQMLRQICSHHRLAAPRADAPP